MRNGFKRLRTKVRLHHTFGDVRTKRQRQRDFLYEEQEEARLNRIYNWWIFRVLRRIIGD